MEEQQVQQEQPMTFADRWHMEKLLKRSKKKSRKALQQKGYSHSEARSLVKGAIKRIASNKPAKKAAGRGG